MLVLSIKVLLPLAACVFVLSSGQKMKSVDEIHRDLQRLRNRLKTVAAVTNDGVKSDPEEYQSNISGLLQRIENDVLRLEHKIDILVVAVNKDDLMPMDCEDVRERSQEATIASGLYLLQAPGLLKRRVYCNFTEQETWTTISRRVNEEDIFNRSWTEYKNGFGNPSRDYWIGNQMLHKLTLSNNYYLRITMSGFRGLFTSSYTDFKVGDEASQYLLQLGPYDSEHSNGGDSFFPTAECNSNGSKSAPFSTYDSGIAKICSNVLSGGWWFTDCGCSNLNGKYVKGGSVPTNGPNMGLYWETVYYGMWGMKSSLRDVIMEIRRM